VHIAVRDRQVKTNGYWLNAETPVELQDTVVDGTRTELAPWKMSSRRGTFRSGHRWRSARDRVQAHRDGDRRPATQPTS